MSADPLHAYLARPHEAVPPELLTQIDRGPIDPHDALSLNDLDRLLDPAAPACETGWCTLRDGVGYVAVRTAMPRVTGEMVDWWFDWHPRDSLRYRAWHPSAHLANSIEPPRTPRARAHWGAVHHPVEDVGLGVVHARIEFCAPSELGFTTDALDDPRVAAIACGYAGDDRLRTRHSPMVHVWLRDGEGTVLRSRFWLGAALRPYGPLGALGARALNRPAVRRRAIPRRAPAALARHCAEEYTNLAAVLPELYGRYGSAAATQG